MKNPVPDLLPEIFGSIFSLSPATHYYYQGPFILMGDAAVLNELIRRNRTGDTHTLSAAISQTKAFKGVMNTSGVTLFLQLSAGPDPVLPLVDKRYINHLDFSRKFNAQYAFLQFSSLEDRMYAHLSVYGDSLEVSPLVPRRREIRLRSGRGRTLWHVKNHPIK